MLVTLGPHPQLDIWEKSLELKRQIPHLILIRVAPPGSEPVDGVIDLIDALGNQPDDRLVFDQYGRGDDVAAYFHTGGTTGVPKLAMVGSARADSGKGFTGSERKRGRAALAVRPRIFSTVLCHSSVSCAVCAPARRRLATTCSMP